MGHIGKPSGYPLQVLAVAVGFTLLSLMRQEVSVAYSFPPFSPFLPPPSRMKSCPDSLSKFFVFHLSLVRICREKRLMNSVGAEPALKKRSAEGKGRKGKFEKRSLNLAEA